MIKDYRFLVNNYGIYFQDKNQEFFEYIIFFKIFLRIYF